MKQKRILKTISNFILTGALVASLSSVALAAPPAQSGDQGTGANQNSGANQENNGSDNQGSDNGQNNSGSNQGAGTNQNAVTTQNNNNSLACAQTYVVQQGDTLGAIANRFFTTGGGSDRIIQATNAAVGTGSDFTNISDPNLIVPGQTLCIPAAAGTTANNTTGSPAEATAGSSGTQNNTANVRFNEMLTDNPDRGLLVIENLSGSDIIFDLTQPEAGMNGSTWVAPSQQQTFLLLPGQHQYTGHQPLGEFGIAANGVQVRAGQITWLSCFRNQCQVGQASMLPGQQMQQQQQGQQIQQQSSNNNTGNQ